MTSLFIGGIKNSKINFKYMLDICLENMFNSYYGGEFDLVWHITINFDVDSQKIIQVQEMP